MVVGYAAFNTNLNVKGTSSISSNWDIRITDVSVGEIHGDAENTKAPTWNELTANVEADLYSKGDYIEYIVTVENKGTVDAVLSNVTTKESDNEAVKITFSGVNINDRLFKGESVQIKVKVEYNPEYSGEGPVGSGESTITLDYTQSEIAGEPVLNPNLYVSSKGSDTDGIGTKNNPYLTIAKAYNEASDDSTIYIMDDITQNETLNFDQDKNITITSDGTRHSIIRGNDSKQAIMNQISGTLTLENIVVDGNNVEANNALVVLHDSNSTLNINSAIIKNGKNTFTYDNKTPENLGGGVCATQGILNVNNTTISNNQSDYGGGIYVDQAFLNIYDSNISYNSSISNGGGITANSNVTIKSSEILHNNSAGNGGGMHVIGENVNLVSVKISDNVSDKSGGGIMAKRHLAISENSFITNNQAKNGGGGMNFLGSWNVPGLYINDVVVSGNKSGSGGGVDVSNVSTGSVKIVDSKITNNISTSYAGGLHIANVNGGVVENTIVSDNQAVYGGGINASSSSVGYVLNINNSQINNNVATGNVGGLRIDRISVTATNVTISNNRAPAYAGVSCTGRAELPIKFIFNGKTIRNNTATGDTGGILISSYCTYTRNSGTVCGNKPTNSYETQTTCPAS